MWTRVDPTLRHVVQRVGDTLFLGFDYDLERRFQEETRASRCSHVLAFGIAALLIYQAFLPLHVLLLPDVAPLVVFLHLGLQTPFAALCLFIVSRNPPPALRETLIGLVTISGSLGVMVVCARSRSPMAPHLFYGVGLIVIFCNVMLQTRFWYAFGAMAVTLVLGCLPWLHGQNIDAGLIAWTLTFLLCLSGFTLVCNYTIERAERRRWLAGRHERRRFDQLKTVNRRLEHLSIHDPLTQLVNRRGLDLAFARLLSEPSHRSVAVLVLDVDHFKTFNDRYGHLAGDDALRRIAGCLLDATRGGDDVVARFGGEEFIVLLPDLEAADARSCAERLRRSVEALALANKGATYGIVTTSIGIAIGRLDGTTTLATLTSRADGALYAAKRDGRNMVALASSAEESERAA